MGNLLKILKRTAVLESIIPQRSVDNVIRLIQDCCQLAFLGLGDYFDVSRYYFLNLTLQLGTNSLSVAGYVFSANQEAAGEVG